MQKVVKIAVVKFRMDCLFDVLEITHHSISVYLFCFAVNGNKPVVAMNVPALAFIVEIEAVRACYLHLF